MLNYAYIYVDAIIILLDWVSNYINFIYCEKRNKKKTEKREKKLSSIKNNGGRFQVIAGHIWRYMSICTGARTPNSHATLTPLCFNNTNCNTCDINKERWRGVELSHHRIQFSFKCFSPHKMNLGASLNKLNITGTESKTFLITPVSYVAFFRAHPANILYSYLFFYI